MKIDYLGGGYEPGTFPENHLPEVAFVGRSNVGKSSLINALCRRKQLARVSRTPGRTQAVHFFAVGDRLCLVDLPGFGFAKAPIAVRNAWQPLISSYLDGSKHLRMGCLLVDCRRDPKAEEHELCRQFIDRGVELLVVATKIDKLARTRRGGRVQQLASALGLRQSQVIGFSAQSRDGLDAVWDRIDAALRGSAAKSQKSPGSQEG